MLWPNMKLLCSILLDMGLLDFLLLLYTAFAVFWRHMQLNT
jgi:hypothetical protein